jgi:hypothetical protein
MGKFHFGTRNEVDTHLPTSFTTEKVDTMEGKMEGKHRRAAGCWGEQRIEK